MTYEQQQIALCEAMGWKLIGLEHPIGSGNTAWSLECAGKFHNALPDCNSLDVLHEMALKVSLPEFGGALFLVITRGRKDLDARILTTQNLIALGATATAPQFREALLRTLNLWKD